MKTRFGIYPGNTEDTASSRIRVYTLAKTLTGMGIPVSEGYSRSVDILFIQKRVTPEILQVVRKAKQRGCLVIYDVDDLGDALWDWIPRQLFEAMLIKADVVTTDTVGHREKLLADYDVSRVEIIPDAIDYYPSGPIQLLLTEAKPMRVLWFGTLNTTRLFEQYIATLYEIPDLQVVVLTAASAIGSLREKYPGVQFLPWSRTTFISSLQSCHLTCLMHDGSEDDRIKSNNKMITSINWGVPSVVSRTAEYERTAREAGVEHCIFTDKRELQAAVEGLRSIDARKSYLATAQPYIWQHYAPSVVAQLFLQLVDKYCHESVHSPTDANHLLRVITTVWRSKFRA